MEADFHSMKPKVKLVTGPWISNIFSWSTFLKINCCTDLDTLTENHQDFNMRL